MPDDIKDLLRTLYDKNVDYHNVKERVVWLAGVIYLTFSVALLAQFTKNADTIQIPKDLKIHTMFALSAIFGLTVVFIIRQTREKVHSSVISEQHFLLMREPPENRTYANLWKANKYNVDQKRKPFWDIISLGWSGHLILGVVYIFFLAQLVVICGVRIERMFWIWLGPTIAIFFPLIVSWIRRIRRCCRIKNSS